MKHQMLDRLSQVAMCMVVALVPACTAMMMNRRGAAMPIMLWTALILSVLLSCGFVLVHDRISNITHFMNEFHVSRLLQERSLLAQADDSNQIFDIGLGSASQRADPGGSNAQTHVRHAQKSCNCGAGLGTE